MSYWAAIIPASAAIPLAVAWRANRGSTIRHALAWTWAAWAGWLWYSLAEDFVAAYAALTLTAAAGVAVLGARRPGVMAWNFVIVGLLAVLWLVWAEGLVTRTDAQLGNIRQIFLAGLLLITVINYLPTRLFCGAFLVFVSCASTIADVRHLPLLNEGNNANLLALPHTKWGNVVMVGLAPWFAWAGLRSPPLPLDVNIPWRRFRDRFGLIWAKRLQEQFNTAARNAGWPCELRWSGLYPPTNPAPAEWHATLIALQKRFGME